MVGALQVEAICSCADWATGLAVRLARRESADGARAIAKNRGLLITARRVQHVLDGIVAGHLLDLPSEVSSIVFALFKLSQGAVELEKFLRPGALVFHLQT